MFSLFSRCDRTWVIRIIRYFSDNARTCTVRVRYFAVRWPHYMTNKQLRVSYLQPTLTKVSTEYVNDSLILQNNKNTFCGTRYLSHCCTLHGSVLLSRRSALNIRVATLTLRLHDVLGHLITLFRYVQFPIRALSELTQIWSPYTVYIASTIL